MKELSKKQIDELVLYFVSRHVGKANRIDRWELVNKVFGTNVPDLLRNDDNVMDRAVRDSVSRLRLDGHLICNLGDGNGLWLAASADEFHEFYNYYVAPIRSRAEVARSMKQAAARRFPDLAQPALFNLDGVA